MVYSLLYSNGSLIIYKYLLYFVKKMVEHTSFYLTCPCSLAVSLCEELIRKVNELAD